MINGDRKLIKGFMALCAVLAVPVLIDFVALHSEFAGSWPPPVERSTAEVYQGSLINRGKDFWRFLPLVLLMPAGWFVCRSGAGEKRAWVGGLLGVSLLAVWAPLVMSRSRAAIRYDRDARLT